MTTDIDPQVVVSMARSDPARAPDIENIAFAPALDGPAQIIGTATPEERSAFLEGDSVPAESFVEPSLDQHDTLRLFMPDALAITLAARLRWHETLQPGFVDAWAENAAKLSAIGGRGVWVDEPTETPPSPLAVINFLLTAGELVPKDVAVVGGAGLPYRCIENVDALYETGQLLARFRGYVLGWRYGCWIEHCWGADSEHQLVETTAPCPIGRYYYGVEIRGVTPAERRASEKRARRRERNRRVNR